MSRRGDRPGERGSPGYEARRNDMANSQNRFAIDWIKNDLIETLDEARKTLEAFAEDPSDNSTMRGCLTSLHQVHGTLVMLELDGSVLLADHLERLAQQLFNGAIERVEAAQQLLMQGILQLPVLLEEVQHGVADDRNSVLELVNDVRKALGDPALKSEIYPISITSTVSAESVERFGEIDGMGKARKVRAAYQQVLLSILKGGDRDQAIVTLKKVSRGLVRICDNTPSEGLWRAFEGFVSSLGPNAEHLDGAAVKLLRRIDSELRQLAQDGAEALKRPVPLPLVRQLLNAITEHDGELDGLEDIAAAVEQGAGTRGVAPQGREALATAAAALQEELGLVKDKLDVIVRTEGASGQPTELIEPLKQISNTLALLGFESSRALVFEQVEALEKIGESEEPASQAELMNVASALVQVDENLASALFGGDSHPDATMERITNDAELAVLGEGSVTLDEVKQNIVSYVSSQWNTEHLERVPRQLADVCAALDIIPLARPARLLADCRRYVDHLLAGHTPEWTALNALADAISGIDYYLERLRERTYGGRDDVLDVVERSLEELDLSALDSAAADKTSVPAPADETPAGESTEAPMDDRVSDDDPDHVAADATDSISDDDFVLDAGHEDDARQTETATGADAEPQDIDGLGLDNSPPVSVVLGDVDPDETITLEFEDSPDFDLGNDLFDDATGSVEDSNANIDAGAEPAERDAAPGPSEVDATARVSADPPPDWAVESSIDEAASDVGGVTEAEGVAAAAAAPARDTSSIPANAEPDPEIVEIFVEELDEVLEAVDAQLDPWRENLTDETALGEIRRGFHTLKGSGRIVGANVIGELAWSIENMLNRVLDSTITPDPTFVGVVERTRNLIPSLKTAFEAGEAGDLDAVAELMEHADVLASGGGIDAADDAAAADSDLDLFATEAAGCLAAIREQLEQPEPKTDATFVRALHTLQGGAGTMGLLDLVGVIKPAYKLSEALRDSADSTIGEAAARFFSEAATTIEMLIGDPVLAEVQDFATEFATRADHLIAEIDSPRGDDALAGDAAELLLGAAAFLTGWHEGALDLETAGNMRDALAEAASTYEHRPELARLAIALLGAHQRLEDEVLTDAAHQALNHGHELLLQCIDAEFASMDPPETAELVDTLLAIAPVESDTPAAADVDADTGAEVAQDVGAETTADAETPDAVEAATPDAPEAETTDAAEEGADILAFPGDRDEATAAADDEEGVLSIDELLASADDDIEEISLPPAPDAAKPVLRAVEADAAPTDPEQQADMAAPAEELPDAPVDEVMLGDEQAAGDMAVEADVADADTDAPAFEQTAESSAQDAVADADAEDAVAAAEAGTGAAVDVASPGHLEPMVALDVGHDPIEDGLDFEIIEVFFEEADEILESVDQNTHEWMSDRDNRLYLENLLRALHTLKGGARLAGLNMLGEATHTFESFLIEVQEDQRSADDDFFRQFQSQHDELVSAVGRLKRAVADHLSDAPAAEAEAGAADDTPRLETGAPESATAPEAAASDDVAPAAASDEGETAPAPRRDAGREQEAERERPRQSQEVVRVGSGLLESLVNLAGESSIVRARIEQGMSDFTSALDEMETTIERLREQLRRMEIETEAEILYREDAPEYTEFDPLEMDRYSQQQQLSRALTESASDMLDLKETLLFKAREAETLLIQQARVNTELQEGLMRTRMVPFSRLVPRLRRIVRQVSRELGKEVEFHAYNAEGELDRNLLERMVPPLEHMLRNAVDHGIESTERRRSTGKSPAGRIDLKLSREGGDVVLEISDDGAGIDVDTVRAKAVERGLLAPDASLSDEEISQFVLAPGFTTAKSVTQISGRGVGMDVVHSEVKQLGGSIGIHSRPGKGTRITVRLPFSVSVNRALLVAVGEDQYAIPLNTIEGIVLLSNDELARFTDASGQMFEYAGIPYQIRYLGHYLGREYETTREQASVPVVLVRSGDHAMAVFVDSVQGSREIVVKSLGAQFAGVGGISGATILGDGSVVVILDLLALIRGTDLETASSSPRPAPVHSSARCVMVVDDSVTVRKVTSRLLERQGMDVIVAKDGVEAVALLQERKPDIMLLDIEMPRMDGFEVARQVRHDDRLDGLPIVMISSRTGNKHQEHALEVGVNRFLGKPFQENELLATIDELV